jgi:2-dehydro-3-deoxygluconokinase
VSARIATIGETMVLMRARDIGSLRHVSEMVLGVGGAESNVAIGLRRLGIDVAWLGRVGDDPLGERVTREIRAEGVDVRGVIDTQAPTGLMLKERPSPSSTAVFYYRTGAAGSRLQPDDIPPGWMEDVEVVHVTGITALLSDSARLRSGRHQPRAGRRCAGELRRELPLDSGAARRRRAATAKDRRERRSRLRRR